MNGMKLRYNAMVSLEREFGLDLDDIEMCLQLLGECYYADKNSNKILEGELTLSYNLQTTSYEFYFIGEEDVILVSPGDLLEDFYKIEQAAEYHLKKGDI